jgi:hypothetical protein
MFETKAKTLTARFRAGPRRAWVRHAIADGALSLETLQKAFPAARALPTEANESGARIGEPGQRCGTPAPAQASGATPLHLRRAQESDPCLRASQRASRSLTAFGAE